MNRRSLSACMLGVTTVLALGSGGLLLSVSPAAAATCPSVAPSTGAVSPAPGAGTQWPGCDLAGANLSDANLYSANLYGANLQNANLSGANLTQAGLMDADLTGASLAGANLMQTSLDGAILTGATLIGASSNGITGTPASLPTNWILVNGYLAGPGADLAYADLYSADLTGADLASADLTDAKLNGTVLAGADLSGATLAGVSSEGITGTPAALPKDWSLHNGYLVGPGASLYMADLSSQDLSGLTLTGIDLNDAFLKDADLSGADLTGAILDLANLTGTNLTGATLAHEHSVGIVGTPSGLPVNWSLQGGYLIGPAADLQDATLNSFQLNGADLDGADLTGADLISASLAHATLAGADLTGVTVNTATLAGASLRDANLTDATLESSNLTGADLSGADLAYTGLDVNLTDANLAGASLTGTNFDYANLTRASLNQATVHGATFLSTLWSDTTCPDGSNSNKHLKGCFGPLDTTPPVVVVTGVSNGHSYVYGGVPAPGCRTTDNGTVAKPAVLTVATTGSQGVGRFTATCSRAVDLAGNQQQAPVRATYTVLYGMDGFIAPSAGSTVARSAHVITIRFRLTNANGTPIPTARDAALATARRLLATLQGPGITAVNALCVWDHTHGYFTCAIRIPAGVRTGGNWRYTLTASENVGTGFVGIPGVRGTSDPEVAHFK